MIMLSTVFVLVFSVAFAADPCRFEDPELGVIDLTTLGRTDGTAAYKDVNERSRNEYVYSYNPCRPFSEGPDCQNVSACQLEDGRRYSFTLGTQESATWGKEGVFGDLPAVKYQYAEKTAIVFLECSTSLEANFQVMGEVGTNVFQFKLTHKCACWNGCADVSSTTAIVPTTSQATSDACQFVHPEKGVINLSFIGRTDEKAAYSDEVTRTTSNFKYSYNPCRSFSQGSGCIGASVCQVSNDGQETFTLGTQESAWWDTAFDGNGGVASLNYAYGNKKVSVSLQCSTEGNNEFEAYGENPVNTFRFQLTHKCACWNAC